MSCLKNYQLREDNIEFACQVSFLAKNLHSRQYVAEAAQVLKGNFQSKGFTSL